MTYFYLFNSRYFNATIPARCPRVFVTNRYPWFANDDTCKAFPNGKAYTGTPLLPDVDLKMPIVRRMASFHADVCLYDVNCAPEGVLETRSFSASSLLKKKHPIVAAISTLSTEEAETAIADNPSTPSLRMETPEMSSVSTFVNSRCPGTPKTPIRRLLDHSRTPVRRPIPTTPTEIRRTLPMTPAQNRGTVPGPTRRYADRFRRRIIGSNEPEEEEVSDLTCNFACH